MVQRKPVYTPSPRAPASPVILHPQPIRSPPPPPPPPSSTSLKPDLTSQTGDSDNDWDACEDEEQDLIDFNDPPPAPALGNTSPTPHADIKPALSPRQSGPGFQWLEQLQHISPTVDPKGKDTTLTPPTTESTRRRNTNPFLRPHHETQPSNDYKLPSPLWDDNTPLNSSDSKQAGFPLDPRSTQSNTLLGTYPVTQDSNPQTLDRKQSGSAINLDAPHSPSINQQSPSIQGGFVPSSPQKKPSAVPRTPDATTTATRAFDGKNRNEFYQIKHIGWFDGASKDNPRHSPILIQNINGPCPLLALVNCLVLTTPANLHTALVEALRTREQISLGLLLDAVFDELMSERRCASASALPDVGELYSFLITLHSGMNVNPRFVPSSDLERVPSGAEVVSPGSFEDTREMSLYGTFSIPLIHGWLPHRNESAFSAFERTAQTYEDAQNVQFLEEDLEQKIRSNQLTSDDQQLLNDLKIIKQFLYYWPTQLTAHGLDVINRFLKPGQMAILFRNDHFSTILKEPYSNRLMTLVTDAGYSTHDEIVWESLIDINGAASEFCSGDFRSVSHDAGAGPSNTGPSYEGDGWTTVESKAGRNRQPATSPSNTGKQQASNPQKVKSPQHQTKSSASSRHWFEPESSTAALDIPESSQRARTASEQEDHDLALALQLQEEEEERQRNEAAARRARENDLSEEFISRESTRQGPVRIPVRRSGQSQTNPTASNPPASNSTTSNSGVPASSGERAEDTPPPTYEQAAADMPYHPPQNHPSSEHAPIPSATLSTQNTPAYAAPPAAQGLRSGPGASGQRQTSARQALHDQRLAQANMLYGRPDIQREGHKDSDKCLVM